MYIIITAYTKHTKSKKRIKQNSDKSCYYEIVKVTVIRPTTTRKILSVSIISADTENATKQIAVHSTAVGISLNRTYMNTYTTAKSTKTSSYDQHGSILVEK